MDPFPFPLPDLESELRALLAQIPSGRVTTYGDLADALGLRTAARWVGEYLRDHPHAADCPCHRVVRKEGELGLYLRDQSTPRQSTPRKQVLLQSEGIPIKEGRIDRFDEFIFRDFDTTKPLARLIELQYELVQRVRLDPYEGEPHRVAGLDVSYRRDGSAVGACAIVETDSGNVVWSTTRQLPAALPYIPSLLTFRELPMLLTLFQEARTQFGPGELDLFLVDGNGILHPRGAGVATCFGVTADVPTIGVAKSLLCGQTGVSVGIPASAGSAFEGPPKGGTPTGPPKGGTPTEERPPGGRSARLDPSYETLPIMLDGRVVATALRRNRSKHALYVSPGQRIDVPSAARLTALLDFGHRLPEPLYWADRLSRAEARRET